MSASAARLARRTSPTQPSRRCDHLTLIGHTVRGMWVILLEIGLVIGLAAFIVWWTWPKRRDVEGDDANDGDGHDRGDGGPGR